jgi:hypothetical protein
MSPSWTALAKKKLAPEILGISGSGLVEFCQSTSNRRSIEVFIHRLGGDVDIHGQILVSCLAIHVFQFRFAFEEAQLYDRLIFASAN